jgi:hypothetical protein
VKYAISFLKNISALTSPLHCYTVLLNNFPARIPMATLRASYSIAPDVLERFNAIVPSSERSRTVQSLMENVLDARERAIRDEQEAVAREFASHPDFAQARDDAALWDATLLDGLGVASGAPPQ